MAPASAGDWNIAAFAAVRIIYCPDFCPDGVFKGATPNYNPLTAKPRRVNEFDSSCKKFTG